MSRPSPRPLTSDEAQTLNANIPGEFEDYLGPRSAGEPIIEGPVHLPTFEQENFRVVLGDLHVDGLLVNPEHTSLVVTGSLRAGTLLTMGKLIVLGDVVVTGDVYGNSFNDEVCAVKGNLTARCVLEKGHSFEVLGGLSGEAAVSQGNVISAQGSVTTRLTTLGGMSDDERLRVFDSSLFDDSGGLSETIIVSRLRAGLQLLRAS